MAGAGRTISGRVQAVLMTPMAVQRAGFWLCHIAQIGVLVLLSIAAALCAARLLLLQLMPGRLAGVTVGLPSRRYLRLSTVAAVLISVFAGYMAWRPDEYFYVTVGDSAFVGGDFGGAILYYRPLVEWETKRPDVYLNLATSYLRLRRCEPALDTLERFQRLRQGGSAAGHVLAAMARECLGQHPEALSAFARALDLAAPSQRPAISAYREAFLRRHPSSAR